MGPHLISDPNREIAYVWMYEPWSRTVMCFFCHTKEKGDYGWVKCEGRADNRYMCNAPPIDASGSPVPSYTWATATETMTTTYTDLVIDETTVTQTLTAPYPYAPVQAELDPRTGHGSWHHDISFKNPFRSGPARFCGDIEHEKRGKKGKEEYRIQHVHAITDRNPCENSYDLDLEQEVVTSIAATTTKSEIAFTQSTYTATAVVETTAAYSLLRQAPRSEEAEPVHSDL
jgi:hypothetical protein